MNNLSLLQKYRNNAIFQPAIHLLLKCNSLKPSEESAELFLPDMIRYNNYVNTKEVTRYLYIQLKTQLFKINLF